MHEETIEIGDKTDIGRAIMAWQALLCASEAIRLRFTDGGKWIGGCTITRADDDLTYNVDGCLFQGTGDDKGIALKFTGEGDGPIGLPISVWDEDGCMIGYYTDDGSHDAPLGKDAKPGEVYAGEYGETGTDAETVKAAFFASGASFTAATAPAVKPESHLGYAAESAKVGAALDKAATAAEKGWLVNLGREKGQKGGKGGEKWFRFQGRTLAQMAPGEKVEGSWPRRMPKPEKRAPEPKVRTAKPAPDAPKVPEKRAVHKRAGKGAPVVALSKVA